MTEEKISPVDRYPQIVYARNERAVLVVVHTGGLSRLGDIKPVFVGGKTEKLMRHQQTLATHFTGKGAGIAQQGCHGGREARFQIAVLPAVFDEVRLRGLRLMSEQLT